LEVSAVYRETIRDLVQANLAIPGTLQRWVSLYVAHEMAHAPGPAPFSWTSAWEWLRNYDVHSEGGILGDDANPESKFADPTIRRFREATRWWR
jgi:hypothetical protein